MTTYKSVLAIFVLPINPEVVITVVANFRGILINLIFLIYYNCGSDYIT